MNNMRNKILSLLVLLLTAATGAQASIAVGDVFMFGTNVNFGSPSVYCKFKSGSNDTDKTGMSGNPLMTYGGYDGVKHKLVFTFTSATSYLYIVSDNPVQPYGIKVSGGDGTQGNLFTFSAVYDLADGHTADLKIGSDDACTFAMPPSNATATYELVRDMAFDVTATLSSNRIRITKDASEKFVTAEDDALALTVSDVISGSAVAMSAYDATTNVDGDYTATLQKQGDTEDSWTDVTALSVGNFRYKITGAGNYSGICYSEEFELFEGYEIKVAAGEYATYYNDEALKVEDQEVELLTITAVESGKAVLSDASDAMPKNTPFLVHNNGIEEKTILLIPCNEPDLAVTVADEFIGTLTEKTFTDQEMGAGADFYVCNGKEFIKVRGKGTLAANKAFLFVEGNNTPASIPFRRSIGGEGEGTTSIDNLNVNDNDNEATWYDLNGRRLQGKPSQKGIYIKNGKKVVVK